MEWIKFITPCSIWICRNNQILLNEPTYVVDCSQLPKGAKINQNFSLLRPNEQKLSFILWHWCSLYFIVLFLAVQTPLCWAEGLFWWPDAWFAINMQRKSSFFRQSDNHDHRGIVMPTARIIWLQSSTMKKGFVIVEFQSLIRKNRLGVSICKMFYIILKTLGWSANIVIAQVYHNDSLACANQYFRMYCSLLDNIPTLCCLVRIFFSE